MRGALSNVVFACAQLTIGAAFALSTTSIVAIAAADEPPKELKGEYSPYEKESLEGALATDGRVIETSAEGKIVEGIDVVILEVIEKRDPAPRLLNVFHTTTKPYVIDREVLLRPGEPFRQALLDETARNLRDLIQLSLVICVPVKGSTPDKVRILVVTKDVWSFRLNSNFRVVSGPKLEYLFVQPSEWNVAGTHQQVALQATLQPLSLSIGVLTTNKRLFGSRVATADDANIILNRDTGKPEGSIGSVEFGKPLYSALSEWSWDALFAWRNEIARRYSNAELYLRPSKVVTGVSIPDAYKSVVTTLNAAVTRSFGWTYKNDFSLGIEANRRVYSKDDLGNYDPRAAAEFARVRMPLDDTRVDPYVEWHTYTSEFLRTLELETLGLQEDFRLGHEAYLRFYPVSSKLGSTRDFVGFGAGVQHTQALGDGLWRLGVESFVEADRDQVYDAVIDSRERFVSPRGGFGRIVFDGRQVLRPRNFLNRTSLLGGDGRLRGYPTSYLAGKDLVVYSFEYRTPALEIWSVQLGGAIFWDTGDAFDGSGISLKHGTGVGLRFLFPQLDRYVLRADFGFPVYPHGRPADLSPMQFVITFQQAFTVPSLGRGSIFSPR